MSRQVSWECRWQRDARAVCITLSTVRAPLVNWERREGLTWSGDDDGANGGDLEFRHWRDRSEPLVVTREAAHPLEPSFDAPMVLFEAIA
jgi:hypothetical protein